MTMADVKIYRTTYCPYCNMAKRLFQDMGVDYEEIDVTTNDEMRHKLVEETGMRTVPQIFVNGESVGGYTDVKALKDSGKLQEMLGQ
jgi:glutaredoxin 3